MMATYKLGRKSRRELFGVHTDLVLVVSVAIYTTPVDFGVHDGLRQLFEQKEYVRTGASFTMNSKHLVQKDGYGHAVDLVPYINGKLRWEWPPIYQMARAVYEAAHHVGVPLVWGGVWDRNFLSLDPFNLEGELQAYAARRKALGKRVFLDGPHFQLAPPILVSK